MDVHVGAVLIAAGRMVIGCGSLLARSGIGCLDGVCLIHGRERRRGVAMRLGCGVGVGTRYPVCVGFKRQNIMQCRQAPAQESDGYDKHRDAAFEYP